MTRSETISLKVEPKVAERLDKEAEEEGQSRSEYIREILDDRDAQSEAVDELSARIAKLKEELDVREEAHRENMIEWNEQLEEKEETIERLKEEQMSVQDFRDEQGRIADLLDNDVAEMMGHAARSEKTIRELKSHVESSVEEMESIVTEMNRAVEDNHRELMRKTEDVDSELNLMRSHIRTNREIFEKGRLDLMEKYEREPLLTRIRNLLPLI